MFPAQTIPAGPRPCEISSASVLYYIVWVVRSGLYSALVLAVHGDLRRLDRIHDHSWQRLSAPSHRVQCLLFTLRMLVVSPSGSIRSNSLKSTGFPLASSFAARFLVASIRACCDDGIPHRAVASSRPSAPLRTIGAL